MILIDSNLLFYAYDADSSQHASAAQWLEHTLTEHEEVAVAWITILAFLRISTSSHALAHPLTLDEATDIVDSIVSSSNVLVLQPTAGHWMIFRRLLIDSQAVGNLTSDAHLATLALEHDCMVATNDKDFTRFTGLKIINPIAKQ